MTDEIKEITHLTLTPSRAKSAIIKCMKAKRVPMLHGSPAIGKSSIIQDIAAQFGLKLIDLRLGQTEPQDMLGYPSIDREKGKSGYLPMEDFPVAGDTIPKGYKGWLLFLDEITSARPETQAAAYKLILDRMAGQHKLHDQVAIAAAGNLETDNAVVFPMSSALQTRMVHLELRMDVREWIDWAIDKKLDHRIMDYIEYRPDSLYTFNPDHTDKTYASPRTWEMTNDMLTVCNGDIKDVDFLPLAAGCVTEGVAREFTLFGDIYGGLPKLADILTAPAQVRIPEEPGILFALSGSLASWATDDNMEKLYEYIARMPIEFQVVTLRRILKLDPMKRTHKAVANWVGKNGKYLF